VEIVHRLTDAGADLIELGVPFSDPLADGRVNQEAAERALRAGATLPRVLEAVRAIRETNDTPMIFFSYLNPFHAMGFSRALKRAAAAGIDGLLLLDLPVEESPELLADFRANELQNIRLVTPTTPTERVRRIVRSAGGFVYCVSRAGVTGAQERIEAGAGELLQRTRSCTDLPLALGFGISTPRQAAEAAQLADAVVVGSAIVRRLHEEGDSAAGRKRAVCWVKEMIDAVKER
jgi:tryptophan synthase alpha chain